MKYIIEFEIAKSTNNDENNKQYKMNIYNSFAAYHLHLATL